MVTARFIVFAAGTLRMPDCLRTTMIPIAARVDAIHRQQCLDQAARCRRLAYAISDRQAADQLLALAADYERNAWGAHQAVGAI
ncbi:MAG: hypothetical protein ACJ8FJ_08500 [Sphingomicrobium sp.]